MRNVLCLGDGLRLERPRVPGGGELQRRPHGIVRSG